MATLPRELIVKIGANVAGLERETGKATAAINRIGSAAKSSALAGGTVIAAFTGATVALGKMAQAGGRFINVQEAFNRRTGDGVGAIAELREASQGLISDYDLMVGFNRAAALGVAKTADEFGTLVTVSEQLARSLGLEGGAAEALEKLNLGIGRSSRLILDDLGIIVSATDANRRYAEQIGKTADQLSEAEKKEAFRVEALRQANELVEKGGTLSRTAGDGYTQLTTSVDNLGDAFTRLVAHSVEVGGFFGYLREAADGLRIWLDATTQGVSIETMGVLESIASMKDIETVALRLRQENDRLEQLRGGQSDGPTLFGIPGEFDPQELADQIALVNALQTKVMSLGQALRPPDDNDDPPVAKGLRTAADEVDALLAKVRVTHEALASATDPSEVEALTGSLQGLKAELNDVLSATPSDELLAAIRKTREEIEGLEFSRAFTTGQDDVDKLNEKLAQAQRHLRELQRVAQAFGGETGLRALAEQVSQIDPLGGTVGRGGIFVPPVTPQAQNRRFVTPQFSVRDYLGDQVGSVFNPETIVSTALGGLLSGGLSTILGTLGGALGGLFGEDPAAAERRRVQEANTNALEKLREGVARLSDALLSERGGDLSGLQGLLDSLPTEGGFENVLQFYGQFVTGLTKLGLTIDDVERIAEGLGLEFNFTAESIEALRDALREDFLGQITASFGTGFDLLQQEFDLLDIDDPMEQFRRSIDLMAGLVRDDLGEALLDLDAENIGAFIQDFLDQLRAGTIDLDALGSLSIEDFLQGLGFAESALDKLGEAADSTSRILNSPTGFKGAFARFTAADFEIRDPGGSGGGGPDWDRDRFVGFPRTDTEGGGIVNPDTGIRSGSASIVVQGDVYVQANDVQQLERAIVRKYGRGGAVTLRPAYAR